MQVKYEYQSAEHSITNITISHQLLAFNTLPYCHCDILGGYAIDAMNSRNLVYVEKYQNELAFLARKK